MSSSPLITRLLECIAKAPATDMQCEPPIVPRPVLNEETVVMLELDLGFRLPSLARELYLQVANGGFGPGWGILSLEDVVEFDRSCRSNWDDGYPPNGWPDRLVRFCEWGCNIWSGIDGSTEQCGVVRFDPDRYQDQITDCLVPECDSLSDWLTSWLDGTLQFTLAH
jgi:hypothetical protein